MLFAHWTGAVVTKVSRMPEPISFDLPAGPDALRSLLAGDEVLLSGVVFTARDAAHLRLAEAIRATSGALPFDLAGQTLFYAGPTPAAPGRPAGSIGPTTASRMDALTPALLEAGIVAMIGKGPRSEEVRAACERFGAVYFAAVGGIAALLGARVVDATPVAYADLGPEALVRLTLAEFPAIVAIDAHGNDLYATAAAEWAAVATGEMP